MIELVLFDLDGTLLDTAPEIADAVNTWLAVQGLPTVDGGVVRDRIGHGTGELLLQCYALAAERDVEDLRGSAEMRRLLDDFMPFYAATCGRRSAPYPGVQPGLERLRQAGYRLGILTNKEDRYTRLALEAHRLLTQFELIVSGNSLAVRKPDPRTLVHCLDFFRLRPEQALLIGDSAVDVETARGARVPCWAVPYGYNGGRPVADALPDRLLSDFGEAIDLLILHRQSHNGDANLNERKQ